MFWLVSILVSLRRHRTTHNVAVTWNTSIIHWESSLLKYLSADALSSSFACWYRDGTSKLSLRSSFYTVHNSSVSVAGKVTRFNVGWCGARTKVRLFSKTSRPDVGLKGPTIERTPRLTMGGSEPLLPFKTFMTWAGRNLLFF